MSQSIVSSSTQLDAWFLNNGNDRWSRRMCRRIWQPWDWQVTSCSHIKVDLLSLLSLCVTAFHANNGWSLIPFPKWKGNPQLHCPRSGNYLTGCTLGKKHISQQTKNKVTVVISSMNHIILYYSRWAKCHCWILLEPRKMMSCCEKYHHTLTFLFFVFFRVNGRILWLHPSKNLHSTLQMKSKMRWRGMFHCTAQKLC